MKKLRNLLAIVATLSVVFFSGCKKDDPGVRPTVTSTSPAESAVSIATNSSITATFSLAMDPATITAAVFTIKNGTTNVAGVVAYTGTTATFKPTSNLEGNTLYTGTISTGARSKAGDALLVNYVFSFTTAAAPDVVPPVVSLTDPIGDATNVAINKTIVVTFNEAMDSLTVTSSTFTLMKGSTAVAGHLTHTAKTASFKPTNALDAATIYTATITIGAKDISGNALVANKVWSFTTGAAPDVTAPVVSTTNPASMAISVELNKTIVITFSEPMDPLTITSSTFTLMQGTTAIPGAVTYSGLQASFVPTAVLTGNTVYTATIKTGAKDLAGNALAANTEWSFTTVDTTDVVAPLVTLTDPTNNATGIAINQNIVITFNEAMKSSTITSSSFTLMQDLTVISGTVSYLDLSATFNPTTNLEANKVYTATVTTAATDLAGNGLAINEVWSFTTAASAATLAPVDLGAAANYMILAKTAINNSSTSALTGDLGLSPAATSYITGLALTNATGYATSAQVTGKLYAADMADPTPINLTTAVENMITAYNDAAGRPSPDFLELATGNIGGKTLTAGLYKWTNTVTLPSDVTISGGANDVWIFQIAGDLTMSAAVNVTLVGGAQAKNIFWQVAGQATFGSTSHFEGIILSKTGVTFQTGASMNGRVLAQTAVVLDANAITKP